MTSFTLVPTPERMSGEPQWLTGSLLVTPGRDPLGFQTITLDRILPRLVPGILALSRRARYFSYYPFLLHEYQQRRLNPGSEDLSWFIRSREFEYAVAVQLCSRGCGSQPTAVVGKQRAEPAARRLGSALDRDYSVESWLGGYGLYYRTPLTDIRVVAPRGTLLGSDEVPIPVDVLVDDRARKLARAFQSVVADTEYYRHHMIGIEPIPVGALQELGDRACLCRLGESPAERQLIREALVEPYEGAAPVDVRRRRDAFRLFLHLLSLHPDVSYDDSAFRSAIWEEFERTRTTTTHWADTVARWAAFTAKEYVQEGFSSIWSHVCQLGYRLQSPEGFNRDELIRLIRFDLLQSSPTDFYGEALPIDPARPTTEFFDATERVMSRASLEEIRDWAARRDTAPAGFALLAVLYRRLPDPNGLPQGWRSVGAESSDTQPGLLHFGQYLRDHLASSPTLGETLGWLVEHFVIQAHEIAAYSRLPNNIFRFRWERGRLRFVDNGLGRFPLADNRRDPLSRLSQDLGYWQVDASGTASLTEDGRRLVEEVGR